MAYEPRLTAEERDALKRKKNDEFQQALRDTLIRQDEDWLLGTDTSPAANQADQPAPEQPKEKAVKIPPELIVGVYVVALDKHVKQGIPMPSDEEIADRLGCHRTTVFRALKGMRAAKTE